MMHEMGYDEFIETLKERLQERFGDRLPGPLVTDKTVRNNSVRAEALWIQDKGSCAAPVAFLRECYDDYREMGLPLACTTDRVAERIETWLNRFGEFDKEEMGDFEKVKGRIFMQLVSYDRNRERLAEWPYVRKLDLALVFSVRISDHPDSTTYCTVSNDLARRWNRDAEQIFREAEANMQRICRPALCPIEDFLKNMEPQGSPEEAPLPRQDGQMHLYVLGLKNTSFGAAAMYCGSTIREFALRCGADIYILPSSIHELILVPDNGKMTAGQLKAVVMSVNRENVAEEDLLSDHVYKYTLKEDSIVIAA